LIAGVAAARPNAAAGEGPAFTVAIAPDAGVLRTDPGLLRRVLFHLLGNAFKFTEEGEIRVEVERGADAGAVLRITDTGVGIAPEQSRRIFELFRQGDDSHTRKHDGVGLGLNLVRACLGFLQGRCHVGAAEGGGTRVEIRLPAITEAAVARQPAVPVDADEDVAAVLAS
jgi:signal transduction histidine kinase